MCQLQNSGESMHGNMWVTDSQLKMTSKKRNLTLVHFEVISTFDGDAFLFPPQETDRLLDKLCSDCELTLVM